MRMSPKQIRRWAKTRQMGRTRFVWLIGVLGWGLISGLCFPLVIAVVGSAYPVVPGWERYPVNLAMSLLLFPIGGYFFGVCTWWVTEREYQRATRVDEDSPW